ncbi:MAG: hypothetical protein Q9214_006993 [Letrouitia sp. 1 TL-2023]
MGATSKQEYMAADLFENVNANKLVPNTVADLEFPWSRMPPVPNESINVHSETDASQNEIYAVADANNQSSSLDFFSLMQFDSPQRASPTIYGGQRNQSDDQHSLAIDTPQQVIGPIRDGTIDPRTLEFRS